VHLTHERDLRETGDLVEPLVSSGSQSESVRDAPLPERGALEERDAASFGRREEGAQGQATVRAVALIALSY
jgi:hypothetical protein